MAVTEAELSRMHDRRTHDSGSIRVRAETTPLPSDTKLLRKSFPESYFSEFLTNFAPSKSPQKNDFSKKSRVYSVIFHKYLFQNNSSRVIILCQRLNEEMRGHFP